MTSQSNRNYAQLSVKDLIEARDMFHVHLMNKPNVIATAIGKYLIRLTDFNNNGTYAPKSVKGARTLANSVATDWSWPCILVFIDNWVPKNDLVGEDPNGFVPKTIYMPDGRTVPICLVEARKEHVSDATADISRLRFPSNPIGGGFPLVLNVQGVERVASVGCIVSDGHKYYALTNKHVTGTGSEAVYSRFGGQDRVGAGSGITLSKVPFSKMYPGWESKNILVNCDAGLVEIDNIEGWKADVLEIGIFDEVYDINTVNFTLGLVARHKVERGRKRTTVSGKVKAYGAASGIMEGEIMALFYRYKSMGGTDYISDFLICGRDGKNLNVAHGDSGTIWLLEEERRKKNEPSKTEIALRPIALHWGQHEFLDTTNNKDTVKKQYNYSMATCLSNICRELDVDVIRGWNIDQDYSWAKTGHFKIAARACDLVKDAGLVTLMKANQKNIGYTNLQLKDKDKLAKAKTTAFIPLADVPDLWWRYKRFATEGSNHFADMDETNRAVYGGKSLLDLCKNDNNIDIDVWIDFYKKFDVVDPKTKIDRVTKKEVPAPRLGALPFRVWQMYNQMVKSLKKGNVDEFICAGGTMSHYVGDACQPLHVSYLHAGIPGQETKVHSDYEDTLIYNKATEIFAIIDKINTKVKRADLVTGGKEAAKLSIELMRRTIKTLPPTKIIDCFARNSGRGKYDRAWNELGKATSKVMADGCYTMAVLWESAWMEGNGKAIAKSKLKACKPGSLKTLYSNYHFVQSYVLTDSKFKAELT